MQAGFLSNRLTQVHYIGDLLKTLELNEHNVKTGDNWAFTYQVPLQTVMFHCMKTHEHPAVSRYDWPKLFLQNRDIGALPFLFKGKRTLLWQYTVDLFVFLKKTFFHESITFLPCVFSGFFSSIFSHNWNKEWLIIVYLENAFAGKWLIKTLVKYSPVVPPG